MLSVDEIFVSMVGIFFSPFFILHFLLFSTSPRNLKKENHIIGVMLSSLTIFYILNHYPGRVTPGYYTSWLSAPVNATPVKISAEEIYARGEFPGQLGLHRLILSISKNSLCIVHDEK